MASVWARWSRIEYFNEKHGYCRAIKNGVGLDQISIALLPDVDRMCGGTTLGWKRIQEKISRKWKFLTVFGHTTGLPPISDPNKRPTLVFCCKFAPARQSSRSTNGHRPRSVVWHYFKEGRVEEGCRRWERLWVVGVLMDIWLTYISVILQLWRSYMRPTLRPRLPFHLCRRLAVSIFGPFIVNPELTTPPSILQRNPYERKERWVRHVGHQ